VPHGEQCLSFPLDLPDDLVCEQDCLGVPRPYQEIRGVGASGGGEACLGVEEKVITELDAVVRMKC